VSVARIVQGVREPALGVLSSAHVQLCPQHPGVLGEMEAEDLRKGFPNIQFRLHANVPVLPERMRGEACYYSALTRPYYRELATRSQQLGAKGYSFHAPRNRDATFLDLEAQTQELESLFGHPVAVEGMYPDRGEGYLLSSWSEYARLLRAKMRYAIDLSHLNIVAVHSGRKEKSLVEDLLSEPRCIEAHVSDNDGLGDRHMPLERRPWWWRALGKAVVANPEMVVFSEGNQRPNGRDAKINRAFSRPGAG
jgi:hypothetical protein